MRTATLPLIPNRDHNVSDEIFYPDSDGNRVAESDFQLTPLVYFVDALRAHFKSRPDVYVAADMLMYFEEGNPKASVAPDVFVTMGLDGNYPRNSSKLWVEGKSPSFIIEILSKGTANRDVVDKKELYQQLGVEEYILYDPVGGMIEPALQGFRLDEGVYRPIPPVQRHNLALYCEQLDLELHLIDDEAGEDVRFFNPFTEQYISTYDEKDEEIERKDDEIERLKAMLRELGKDV